MTRYRFVQWTDELGSIIGTTPTINILVDRDKTLTAYYQEVPVTEYTLTIATTTGGTTSPAPGTYAYAQGSTATVTAIPNSGYAFDHWILDGATRTENPITVLMNGNHTLTAYFRTLPPTQYTLTISTTTGGTTNPSPGTYTYNQGAIVPVTANPTSGYAFDHWSLDGATRTENPISITMNTNHSLTAYFKTLPPPTYTLTIATTTGGTTSPAPGAYSHSQGTSVTVTANPNLGYRFDHWVLDGYSVVDNPVLVTMDKNHSLTAYFSELPPPEFILTVAAKPGGTTDPAPGDHTYVSGTTVQVTAKPDSGYTFDHWELDGVTYTSNPINVLMDKSRSLTAYFSITPPPPPTTYKLNLSVTIGGTTDPAPGIHEYDKETTITVNAIPADGYYFNHWELDGSIKTENPISVLMDRDHTLLAVFTEQPPAPPETIFDKWWRGVEEFFKRMGWPVPPKPPTPSLPLT